MLPDPFQNVVYLIDRLPPLQPRDSKWRDIPSSKTTRTKMAATPTSKNTRIKMAVQPVVEDYENQNGGSTRRRSLRESKWRFNPSSKTTRIKMAARGNRAAEVTSQKGAWHFRRAVTPAYYSRTASDGKLTVEDV